jgi:tRNA uracil 4-sulfurtransferase
VSFEGISQGPEAVLVRYGELTLKGANRLDFENTLARNVRLALEPIVPVRLQREHARLLVFPEGRMEAVLARLQQVFGISSVSPVWGAPCESEAIVECARRVLDDALLALPPGETRRFRVLSRRADKRFALGSMELDKLIAARIVRDEHPLRIDLDHPELVLGVEVRESRAWLYARREPGPGGLPVGTLGRALCLVSGGIDSPVAAWMAMKRGCEVVFVTFHSPPYIGQSAVNKVMDLVRVLGRWQRSARLYVVPFAPVQEALRDAGAEAYRTVLYRRTMHRIAKSRARRWRTSLASRTPPDCPCCARWWRSTSRRPSRSPSASAPTPCQACRSPTAARCSCRAIPCCAGTSRPARRSRRASTSLD